MRRKIVIASDSFKGSLSSVEAGLAAARGVKAVCPEADCEVISVADGGEGTTEAVVNALGGETVSVTVSGPAGDMVKAGYGVCGDMAVIETATAGGITLVPPEKRNPEITTSYGTGQLIADALRRGCRKFIIGLGGSATNDGGIGMLAALGVRFLNAEGKPVRPCGGEAGNVSAIDLSDLMPEAREAEFIVACDVDNPLTGPRGASHVFGPQKGADAEMVTGLDCALVSLARVTAATTGHDYSAAPGAGAAGGLGFAFLAFLGATLRSGVEMVLDATDFDSRLNGAYLVITGEGRLDFQTLMGKTPYGVLRRAKARGIPVVAIGGSVEMDAVNALMEAGFSAVFPIADGPGSLKEALRPEITSANIERTVSQIMRLIGICKR